MPYCLVHDFIPKDYNLNQQSQTYGPLTDLTPVTECGLAQLSQNFLFKVFFVMDAKGQKGLISLDINIQQMSTDTTWQ